MTAPGRYYHVSPRFWQDPRIRARSEDARTLALYLHTSPHRNMVGLFYAPTPYLASDLQWDQERLLAALEELVGAGYVHYDYECQMLLIVDALEADPPLGPKQVAGAVAAVAQLPGTALLEVLIEIADRVCPEFAKALRHDFGRPPEPHRRGTDTAPKPHGSGIDTPPIPYRKGIETVSDGFPKGSDTLPDTPSIPEPDSRTRIPVPGTTHVGAPPSDSSGYSAEFEEFWTAYPRHDEKKKAFRVWQARIRAKVPPGDLIRAAASYAAYVRARAAPPDRIKLAGTFLGPDEHWKEWVSRECDGGTSGRAYTGVGVRAAPEGGGGSDRSELYDRAALQGQARGDGEGPRPDGRAASGSSG